MKDNAPALPVSVWPVRTGDVGGDISPFLPRAAASEGTHCGQSGRTARSFNIIISGAVNHKAVSANEMSNDKPKREVTLREVWCTSPCACALRPGCRSAE